LLIQGHDAGARRHVLEPAFGVSQNPRHDLGRDGRPERSAAQLADELRPVDVLGAERLAEDVGADDRHDHGRLDRIAGSCSAGALKGRMREPSASFRRHTPGHHARRRPKSSIETPGARPVRASLDPMTSTCRWAASAAAIVSGVASVRADVSRRQRDLCREDVSGRGRERALTPLHDLARQPEHRRGLAAPADQRHDVADADAERLGQGQRQPRAPAAARSISSLAPAWIHGKKLVITSRTPRRV